MTVFGSAPQTGQVVAVSLGCLARRSHKLLKFIHVEIAAVLGNSFTASDDDAVCTICQAEIFRELVEAGEEDVVTLIVDEAPALLGGSVAGFIVGSVGPDLDWF